jgi:hypothetical protein
MPQIWSRFNWAELLSKPGVSQRFSAKAVAGHDRISSEKLLLWLTMPDGHGENKQTTEAIPPIPPPFESPSTHNHTSASLHGMPSMLWSTTP